VTSTSALALFALPSLSSSPARVPAQAPSFLSVRILPGEVISLKRDHNGGNPGRT